MHRIVPLFWQQLFLPISTSNYAIYVELVNNVTCESEMAMLERRKLARATISHFLRKCCFLRRSERRAPSIPRALERSEKITFEYPPITFHLINYLNDGTGNPCAGHCKLDAFPAARINEWTRSSLENFGPFAPSGSGNTRIAWIDFRIKNKNLCFRCENKIFEEN